MDRKTLDKLIRPLPKGRTIFGYSRGRYALMLLREIAAYGLTIREIKQTEFGKLLNLPAVAPLRSRCGDGRLRVEAGDRALTEQPVEYQFFLTLGVWGAPPQIDWRPYHQQTSRPGFNLVLQLNFPERHNRDYAKLIDPTGKRVFYQNGHPNCRRENYITLAWVRLDIDPVRREALIEEVQSDWLRDAWACRRALPIKRNENGWRFERFDVSRGMINRRLPVYVDRVLAPYRPLWSEATLAAAIHVLRCEFRIDHLYYHTLKSTAVFKQMDTDDPPRSLYTDLPRKFCFLPTRQFPRFLADEPHPIVRFARKQEGVTWQRLAL